MKGNFINYLLKKFLIIFIIFLFLFTTISMIFNSNILTNKEYAYSPKKISNTVEYEHFADDNTMENYKNLLLTENNGTRYAGRVWSDKSVFAYGQNSNQLVLNNDNDGISSTVSYNADFLHVFSTIGSSQVLNQKSTKPVDVVLLLDISTSMTHSAGAVVDQTDSLHQVIKETNSLIHDLMEANSNNRVAVVVYGGGAQVVLGLGHYTPNNRSQEYIQIASTSAKGTATTATAYFSRIRSAVNEVQNKTSDYMYADATYLQGALYEGMNILATEDTTTYYDKIKGQTLPRIPVLVCLTDGATNIISANKTSRQKDTKSYDWWLPYTGIIPTDGGAQYAAAGANPMYADCNSNTGHGTASSGRSSAENKNLEIQAITPRNVSNLLLAGSMKKKIEANYQNTEMLDYSIAYNVGGLGEYPNEQLLGTLDPKTYFDETRKAGVPQLAQAEIEETKKTLESYINDDSPQLRFPREAGKNYIFTDSNGGSYADFTFNHPSGTYLDDYDVDSFEDIYYVDKYFNANSADIGNIFGQIFEEIKGETFTPIGGTNDSGVDDSITYMDPIGEYMEVKDGSLNVGLNPENIDMAMVLFGEKYTLIKTGIYDYNFSSSIEGFQQGWYDNETHAYLGDSGSWDNATFYLSGSTTRQYVPTLDENNLTDKQRNTVYTIYRFANEDATTKYIYNPCYTYDENVSDENKVRFLLSDIRVWVENIGNYYDTSNGAIVDLGYDQALYANVPDAALPIQTATITLDENIQVDSYETNVGTKAATPLRLFYTVGVQDEIKNGNSIDLSKLSSEYIQKNTDKNGYVNFYSNYFSNRTYDNYVTSQQTDLTMGDPNFSFSPNEENRYYIYQKPLILYKNQSGVYNEIKEDGYEQIGDYTTYDSFKESLEKITDTKDLSRNNYYYIEIDYYKSGKKEPQHALVTREGNEFGPGLAGEGNYNDYLVWYDEKEGKTVPLSDGRPSEGDYVLATKPGGFRIGDMAQNCVRKNNNVTETAGNVYLPTISKNSSGKDIIIDGYLGNNGTLRVKNMLLEVTKEVQTSQNEKLTDEDFEFSLKIPRFKDTTVDAVSIKRNDKYVEGQSDFQKWLVQLDTINLITDNEGFLVSKEDNTARVEDSNGNYIWIGATSNNEYRLYNSQSPDQVDGTVRVDENASTGSINYYGTVHLVPKAESDSATKSFDSYPSEERILYTVDATKETKEQASSDYTTKTTYLRKQLNFDSNGDCKFTLKNNEGVLIEGLDNGTSYEISENLTDRLYDLGYRFDHVYDYEGNNIEVDDNSTTIKDAISNSASTDEIHYVNKHIVLGDLSISKTVLGSDQVAQDDRDNEKEWTFELTLTPPLGVDLGNSYTYRYYDINDTTLNNVLGTVVVNKNEDGTYSGELKLKHNQNIVIKGIEPNTHYEITEKEADENDYKTTMKNNVGDITASVDSEGNVLNNVQVSCVNKNLAEIDLTIKKEVKGIGGDTQRDWTFKITLTPSDDEKLKDSYDYEGSKTGKLELVANQDGTYTGTVTLKHNEYVTIKDLPEGTQYIVEELESKKDGYATEIPDNANGSLLGNSDVDMTFVNTKIQYYSLSVKKSVIGDIDDVSNDVFKFKITFTPSKNLIFGTSYTYTGSKTGTLNLTANGDGTYSGIIELKAEEIVTIEQIPENTNYLVEELDANKNGFVTTEPKDKEGLIDSENQNPNVTFINRKYELKNLTIRKNLEGNSAETSKDWEFTVTLIPEKGVTLADSYEYTGSKSGTITFTKQADGIYKGKIYLKGGEYVTINNIPEKTEYKVEEVEANQNDYKTDIDGRDTGILIEDNTEVTFTNKKYSAYDLTIEKNVVDENGGPVDSNAEWEFNVLLISPEGVNLNETYACEGAISEIKLTNNNDGTYTATVKLKHGQHATIKGLPEGTKYKVEEVNANTDGYIKGVSGNTQGTLDTENKSVQFTNTKLKLGTLTIAKEVLGMAGNKTKEWTFQIELSNLGTVQDTVSYNYTGRSTVENVNAPANGILEFKKQGDIYTAEIKLKHGQGITFTNIPMEASYTVKEIEANENGYTTQVGKQTGTINESSAELVQYSNTLLDKFDLTINKIVDGYTGDKQKDWTFNITLIPENNDNFKGSLAYTGTRSGNIAFVKQSDGSWLGTLKLKHNDKITIKDIPEGTKYKVEEVEANQGNYSTAVEGKTPGILFDSDASVKYTNTILSNYDLAIKKIVEGKYGDKDRSWNFDVVLSILNAQEQTLTYNIERKFVNDNGVEETKQEQITLTKDAVGNYYTATLSIKHGETIIIKNLPENSQYAIVEEEANSEGYLTTYTNSYGNVAKDQIVSEFVNKYISKVDLSIRKLVKGSGDKNRSWSFEIILTSSDGQSIENSYHYVGNKKNGEIEFKEQEDGSYKGNIDLVHDETITLQGLPAGIKYTVIELEANQDDYITTTEGKTSGELSVDTEDVVFINTRIAKVGLTVEKVVKGNAGDKEREWTFEVRLTPPDGIELEKSYKYEGSKSGIIEFVKNADGTYTGLIRLKHGEKITILGLPEGTKYSIIELEANQEGYLTNVTGNDGLLVENSEAYVLFENSKDEPDEPPTEKQRKKTPKTKNPYTGDDIGLNIGLFFTSLLQISVLVTYICVDRKNKKKSK